MVIKKMIRHTHETLKFVKGHVDRIKRTSEPKGKRQKPLAEPKPLGSHVVLDLAPGTVAKATLVVFLTMGLVYFLLQIQQIILIFFIAFLFSAALGPAVNYFEGKGVPRGVGVIIVYLIIFLLLGVVFSTMIPLVATQLSDLASRVGDVVKTLTNPSEASEMSNKLSPFLDEFYEGIDVNAVADQIQANLQGLAGQLLTFGGNIWGAIKVISNGLLNTALVLVLTFIMTVNRKSIDEFIPTLFPSRHAPYIARKLAAVQEKIGFWVRGQVMLSSIVGITVFIGLTILGFEYTTTIALIAFFTELVPVFGPLLALLIAIPVALNQGWWMLLWVAIFFLVLNWIESNIIVPLVMRSAVDISPLVIIFAMLVGANYLGIVGLIIAVPVAAVLSIFVRDYLHRPKAA